MKLGHAIIFSVVCAFSVSACRRADQRPEPSLGTAGVFVFKGQPVSSTSDVAAVASGLLKNRELEWGDPVEILWQDDLDRYLVLYSTPEKEKMEIGDRGVFVMTNGEAIVMPQM